MKKKRRQRPKTSPLMLTPMVDMLTVILIFLIVHYSPETAKIKKSADIKLPMSELSLKKVPRIQIEINDQHIQFNGLALDGLNPSDAHSASWKPLSEALARGSVKKDEPILIMADKNTSFVYVDRTVGHLAANGFSEVYFLTEQDKKAKEGN